MFFRLKVHTIINQTKHANWQSKKRRLTDSVPPQKQHHPFKNQGV
uniref:Uncharacterized protein n=1 Tax=Arundo donax TaxID=35708 RepID=A0A0A9ES09_ARUDO